MTYILQELCHSLCWVWRGPWFSASNGFSCHLMLVEKTSQIMKRQCFGASMFFLDNAIHVYAIHGRPFVARDKVVHQGIQYVKVLCWWFRLKSLLHNIWCNGYLGIIRAKETWASSKSCHDSLQQFWLKKNSLNAKCQKKSAASWLLSPNDNGKR